MAKLVVLNGEKQGTVIEVTRPVAIGSSRNSDLHLRDARVSWNHARITLEGSDVFVEDLGSANGTLLNGTAVQRSKLQGGDTLDVGGTRLELQAEGAPRTAPLPVAAAPVAAAAPAPSELELGLMKKTLAVLTEESERMKSASRRRRRKPLPASGRPPTSTKKPRTPHRRRFASRRSSRT